MYRWIPWQWSVQSLVVVLAWATAGPCLAAPKVLCLVSPAMPFTSDSQAEERYVANTYHREIVRQALLMTARDAFGLGTRDQTLREPIPAESTENAWLLEMSVANVQSKRIEYTLRREDRELASGTIPYLENAAAPGTVDSALVILAIDRLRRMGREPLKLKRRFFNFGRAVPHE
ncbi:MAG: hypothetical protein R3E01_32185 [Pirellulaceae bacterium]|nr:hypothetical protein [Planctomycetales bacterium]